MQFAAFLLTASLLTPLATGLVTETTRSTQRNPSVVTIVSKAKKLNNATTSAKIEFSQSGGGHSGSGTLEYATGDRYRVTLSDRTIVSNGTKVWTWFPGKNQVIINKASARGQLTPSQILQAFPGSYSTSLTGDATVGGRAVWVVAATASGSNRAGDISSAVLYIDKATHRFKRIKVTSPSMGTATITINSAQYNLGLAASRFSFTPPSGAKVIDLS